MKVKTAVDNVRSSQGLGDTAQFMIAATGHAFKQLSSGVYSDKVRAVLREIGCNARDAHIASGQAARPIRVKLPNSLSDQFYIQDWGPGMSHDDVMGLYSTYFASTKQTSNDFTGAFGVGSKSPFSYTDSFSVVSTHGGRKRTYTIYLNNTGAPTTSLMTEEDPEADWPSGVRVGFSVKPADYREFLEKAQLVYQWFDPLPEIKGATGIHAPTFREKRPDFWIVTDPPDPNLVQVVMGSVAYPLDLKALGVGDPAAVAAAKGKPDLLQFIGITSGLVLPIPVGSAMPSLSRETLQYDADTLKAVQDMGRKAVRRMGQEVVQVLEAAEKGGWAELCTVKSKVQAVLSKAMPHSFAALGHALGLEKRRAEQLDQYLRQEYMHIPAYKMVESALRLAEKYSGRGARVHALKPADRKDNAGAVTHFAQSHRGYSQDLRIVPRTVIAHGTERGAAMRAKYAVEQNKWDQVLVVCRDKDHKPSRADLLADARRLSEALGNMELVELGTLDFPPGKGNKKGRKPKGWVPALEEDAEVDCVSFAKVAHKLRLGDIKPRLMMCERVVSKWGNYSVKVREYDKTAEDDRTWAKADWDRIWAAYQRVATEVALPDTAGAYALVTAADIKAHYMREGGFTSAIAEIESYMKRPGLRPALKSKLTKWTPVVPEYVGYGAGWVTHLSKLMYDDASAFAALQPGLEKAKVYDTISEIVLATKAKPTARGRQGSVPPYLESYQFLCQTLQIKEDKIDVDDGVTLEDMDRSFPERFPLAKAIGSQQFVGFYQSDPPLGVQLLELLLSKENA